MIAKAVRLIMLTHGEAPHQTPIKGFIPFMCYKDNEAMKASYSQGMKACC